MRAPLLFTVGMWLCFASVSIGQTTLTYGQQLEAVRSAKEVERFMNSLALPSLGNVKLDTTQEGLQEYCAGTSTAIPAAWVLADLDGDKKLDLLLNGVDSGYLAVLNRGTNKPEVIDLQMRGSRRWCQAYKPAKRGTIPVIHGKETSWVSASQKRRGVKRQHWKYTLMYQLGAFVDYAPSPQKQLPLRIGYKYRRGGPPSEGLAGYDLEIDRASGWVTGTQRVSGDSRAIREFRYQLGTGQLDTLRQRLSYLRVSALKSDYFLSGSDMAKAEVTFYYSDHQKQIKWDRGMVGTHTLCILYDFISQFHTREIRRLQSERQIKK
ncbi:hypothetical protein [Hymenobacter guriensis]|uniref:VCBS repeat-containing protein n=1 Tax=Hymenobacter guriensis TaxID=2793065 RepID=A0ABS0L653_9BACT|nr:hypothetical protein [Hymenobacter guriensis]MBG8555582.1 hypothetical protein [Hymenobacter guriensis]